MRRGFFFAGLCYNIPIMPARDFYRDDDGVSVYELVFDRRHDRYLLVEAGWENGYRIYGTLLHVDIKDGNLWIQHDGTEDGIADELVTAGIPKERIVLAFRPASLRAHTEFAAA